MATTTPKVSLYSLSELKTTLDDHLPIFLSTSSTPSSHPLSKPLRFTPSHSKLYIRLGLGYSAVLIALFAFYQDYILKLEFRDTKQVTTIAVVAYFTLNAALTGWIWFGERGLVFEGARKEEKGETRLNIRSYAPKKKYDPLYRIEAAWTGGKEGSGSLETTVPFTRFFAEDGHLVPVEFENWLKNEMPWIAGPTGGTKTASIKSQVVENENYEGDTIVVARGQSVGVDGDATTQTPRKRGRPRKNPVS